MKLYKLTGPAPDYFTLGNTRWGEGVTHCGTGEGKLCGPGWIHAYTDPLLALLLNPIHGNFAAPLTLWEAEGEICMTDYGLKVGCKSLTTIRITPAPEVSTSHSVAFGILCALEACPPPRFAEWAKGWLSGADRSYAAAHAAYAAADAAYAAYAAADAAYAAADAAYAAYAAADAAAHAAYAAAYAAHAATGGAELDLIALAKKAMEVK